MLAPKPNATLHKAVAIKPRPNNNLGEVRDPKTPLMNFEVPYAIGKIDVMVPISVIPMPREASATKAGAVYVREFLVR
jgi:hypothetical protein